MPHGFRASGLLIRRQLRIVAACLGLLGVVAPTYAQQPAVGARSTLRIGAPRPTATPPASRPSSSSAPVGTLHAPAAPASGGSQLVIRPSASTDHPSQVAPRFISPTSPQAAPEATPLTSSAKRAELEAEFERLRPTMTSPSPGPSPSVLQLRAAQTAALPDRSAPQAPPARAATVQSPPPQIPPAQAAPDRTAAVVGEVPVAQPPQPLTPPARVSIRTADAFATDSADGVSIGSDGALHDEPTTMAPAATMPIAVAPVAAAPSQSLPVVAPFQPNGLPSVQPYPVSSAEPQSSSSPAANSQPAVAPQPTVAVRSSVASPMPPATSPSAVPEVLPQVVDVPPQARALEAVAADPSNSQPLPLEPVDFNGVLLGETTLDEVVQNWGKAISRADSESGVRLTYQIDPFAGVEVTFIDGRATAVVVDLGDMFPPADVAKELNLNLADAVAVLDSAGDELGLVFPERGVSMRYEDGAAEPRVAQIGLDRISSRPFVMRAERRRIDRPSAALVDLATALKLNPEDARAHWLRGRILASAGRPKEALSAVETALKLDPKAAEYILSRAGLLADQGLFDAALKDNETVLAGTQKLPHYQARAWRQRGDFMADGPEPDDEQALDAHTRALRVAETLVNDPTAAIRRDAKQTVIEAQLAIADDIAWGDFQAKEAAAGRWLAKAETVAKQAIMEDGLSPYLLLEVYQRGLAACVGTPGCVDPLDWAERLERTSAAALKNCDDPLKRRQIQFDAGLGLYDALQALHARGDIENALRFGTLAVDMIQAGRVGRDETPNDAYRFGRLYFRIGSLYAVNQNDHQQAVAWFDRAAPLLERPLPDAAAADRGRQGETLVSMGISYWATGKRERGLQLTDVGTRYMQRAVSEGLLSPAAMGVAYSNLAVMHDGLGDQAAGRRFHEMAARAEAAPPTLEQGGTLRR